LFDVLAHRTDDKTKERVLERIALYLFGIAVLAEIVAYPYGQRNDTLSERIIGSLDAKARSALEESEKADAKASDAALSAKAVKEESTVLATRMGIASRQLTDLEQGFTGAKKESEALRQQNMATQRELTDEQAKRSTMERSLAPRMLPVITGRFGNTVSLQQFFGLRVIIEYVPDAEARRAAEEIRSFVGYAHWESRDQDLSANPQLFAGFFDGVVIGTYFPLERNREDLVAAQRSGEAAEALMSVMRNSGWRVRNPPGVAQTFGPIPKNAIKIMIGMKPNDFQHLLPPNPD